MQNDRVLEAVTWNPWHGCKKCSAGCQNCFVFKMDKRYGRDTNIISPGVTTYNLKAPLNSLVKLCFTSDLFIEEADDWRQGVWDQIRQRSDCIFVTTTKRPERIRECLPSDWGNGWPHVHISVSIENQEMADKRVPALLSAPLLHREVFCSPLIGPIKLDEYLRTGLIKCVNVGGEKATYDSVRPTQLDWVYSLFAEAKFYDIEFYFHQTGNCLIRNGVNIGTWNMNDEIRIAEDIQHQFESAYNGPVYGTGLYVDINKIPTYLTVLSAIQRSVPLVRNEIVELLKDKEWLNRSFSDILLKELLCE